MCNIPPAHTTIHELGCASGDYCFNNTRNIWKFTVHVLNSDIIQIQASDLCLWDRNESNMEVLESMGMYAQRFTIR